MCIESSIVWKRDMAFIRRKIFNYLTIKTKLGIYSSSQSHSLFSPFLYGFTFAIIVNEVWKGFSCSFNVTKFFSPTWDQRGQHEIKICGKGFKGFIFHLSILLTVQFVNFYFDNMINKFVANLTHPDSSISKHPNWFWDAAKPNQSKQLSIILHFLLHIFSYYRVEKTASSLRAFFLYLLMNCL